MAKLMDSDLVVSSRELEPSFAVLNPGGKDPQQLFLKGPGKPEDSGHPPVNYHAYAACLRGGFYREVKTLPLSIRVCLVLLRGNLKDSHRAVRHLVREGMRVFITFKETGMHQVLPLLGQRETFALFQDICRQVEGFIAPTPWIQDIFRAAGCSRGGFVPTPYPVEFPAWNFSTALEARTGIFIGTREFFVPLRNHLLALMEAIAVAQKLNCRVSVVNTEGRQGRKFLSQVAGNFSLLEIHERKMPYPEYLQCMSTHRVVYQRDVSQVPGQVAGDAALCRIPCLGGRGAIDRLLEGGSPRDLEAVYQEPVFDEAKATAEISFAAGAERLLQAIA